MSLIAFASCKFSPGASSVAELVALRRPQGDRRCVLVDCDPAGSEWLLRPGVAPEPGLVNLAMAGRKELASEAALHHTQTVGGLEVLVGPAAARQATGALDILGDRLGAHLAELRGVDVVADCGRLEQRSPALGVLASADVAVLVARPAVSDMVHLAPWVEQLSSRCRLSVVLVGSGRGRHQVAYEPAEIAEALRVPVLGVVADDLQAAARLFSQPGSLVGLFRSRLVRSATSLSATVFAAAAERTDDERRTVSEEVRSR